MLSCSCVAFCGVEKWRLRIEDWRRRSKSEVGGWREIIIIYGTERDEDGDENKSEQERRG